MCEPERLLFEGGLDKVCAVLVSSRAGRGRQQRAHELVNRDCEGEGQSLRGSSRVGRSGSSGDSSSGSGSSSSSSSKL